MPITRLPLFAALFSALTLIAAAPSAQAKGFFPPVTNPDVVRECSDCHMLYRPEMLPVASWKTIMGQLDSHFGEVATLKEPLRTDIESYLVGHASDVSDHRQAKIFFRSVDLNNPPKRVTETPRFIRKHRELDPAVFTSKEVGSKAHCNACHREAKNGIFDEDTVKIPGYINLPFGINIKPLW